MENQSLKRRIKMLRRTPIILSVVVVVFVFFAVTEAMAQTFPPQTCAAGPFTISVDGDHFGLPVYSQSDPNFSLYPCWVNSTTPCAFPYYVYEYDISPQNNISAISEVLPVCQNSIQVLATEPQSNHVLAPGLPEFYGAKTSWPVGIYDGYVLTWSSNPSSGKFWVITNTGGVDINSMVLKSGSNFYYCNSGIGGPGCGVASFVPVNNVEDKTLGEFQVKITRNRGSWCASTVQYLDPNTNQWVTLEPEPATINGQDLINCGNPDGNQRCQECIIYGESSPGCYSYVSGGVTYKVPKGCK
jgi:hypothetical protein